MNALLCHEDQTWFSLIGQNILVFFLALRKPWVFWTERPFLGVLDWTSHWPYNKMAFILNQMASLWDLALMSLGVS